MRLAMFIMFIENILIKIQSTSMKCTNKHDKDIAIMWLYLLQLSTTLCITQNQSICHNYTIVGKVLTNGLSLVLFEE